MKTEEFTEIELENFLHQIHYMFADPFVINGTHIYTSCSICYFKIDINSITHNL